MEGKLPIKVAPNAVLKPKIILRLLSRSTEAVLSPAPFATEINCRYLRLKFATATKADRFINSEKILLSGGCAPVSLIAGTKG